jgi:transcriptional regulator GlxA family with amidase domain
MFASWAPLADASTGGFPARRDRKPRRYVTPTPIGASPTAVLDAIKLYCHRSRRHARSHCRRIAATCHGAFVLAEAGLLDGRRATTHWSRAGELRARYPNVRVEEDRIFIADGPVWTSAGMTAGIDLALA